MRSLPPIAIENLKKKVPSVNDIDTFIESGTYLGDTIFAVYPKFRELHTIEICQRAYERCVEKSKKLGVNNINFHLGDTLKVLPKLIEKFNKPVIYFLDAHATENNSGFTSKSEISVPLLEELKLINDKDQHASVIIIDDMRCFGSPDSAGGDWSQISTSAVLKQFDKGRVNQHFVDPLFDPNKKTKKLLENDRYYIILNPKNK